MYILSRDKLNGYLIGLDEAKSWLRVTSDVDDQLITGLIESAEVIFENYTGLSAAEMSVKLAISGEDAIYVAIPFMPAHQLSVLDENNEVVEFEYDASFGYITVECSGNCSVYYTTANEDDAAIRSSILQILALLYQNRGDVLPANELANIGGMQQLKRRVMI